MNQDMIRWDRFNNSVNMSIPAIQQDIIKFYEEQMNGYKEYIDPDYYTVWKEGNQNG